MRKKSVCIRIGARFEAECCKVVTSEGQVLIWANGIRYLGIYIVSASSFALWIMLNVPSIGPSMPFLGKLVESLQMRSLYS